MRPAVVAPTLLIALATGCVHTIDYAVVKVRRPQTVTLETRGEHPTMVVPAADAPTEEIVKFPDHDADLAQRHADGSLDLFWYRKMARKTFPFVGTDGAVHHMSFGWSMGPMGTILAADLPKARAETFRAPMAYDPNLVVATPWENVETVTIHSEPPRWIGVFELVVGAALLFGGGYYFANGMRHDDEGHHEEIGVGFAIGASIFLGSGLWMLAAPSEEHAWPAPR